MNPLQESEINIVSTHSRLEGKITLDRITRVHGMLSGEIHCTEGSTLILMESAVVEGSIFADNLTVNGYVKGDIVARTKVTISSQGRVIGNIKTPSLSIAFGAHFEGQTTMNEIRS